MAATVTSVLALLCIASSSAWAGDPVRYSGRLTRQNAVQLLAEGSVRARYDLPPESSVDKNAVDEAKRWIRARLENGWELQFKQMDDCSFWVSYSDPKKRYSTGISVLANEKKQITDVLQPR
jgi:hypothetical protein